MVADAVGGGGRVAVTVGGTAVGVSVSLGVFVPVGSHGRVGRRVGISGTAVGCGAGASAGGAAPPSAGAGAASGACAETISGIANTAAAATAGRMRAHHRITRRDLLCRREVNKAAAHHHQRTDMGHRSGDLQVAMALRSSARPRLGRAPLAMAT